MVRLSAYLIIALCAGCGNRAQSQEQHASPAADTALTVSDSVSASRQNAITRAVRAVTPAIVSINVMELQRVVYRDPMAELFNDPFFRPFFANREQTMEVENLGSGFIVSPDGYIVTNDHLAGNATRISVSLNNGYTLDAQLVGSDPISDLALLKVNSPVPLPYLTFAAKQVPIVGEWAIALGNPFGLFEATEPSVTVGVVSAVGRDLGRKDGYFYYDMIQTDASINRGNSGGPLVNALGQVIGVNTAIYTEDGGSVGLGFAVPARKAERIIAQLRTTGMVDRSYYTGLGFLEVTAETAARRRLGSARGVLVARIDPGSPADQAGFFQEDVIIAVEDERIADFDDYVARIYDFLPGDTLTFDVVRGSQRVEVTMRIGRLES